VLGLALALAPIGLAAPPSKHHPVKHPAKKHAKKKSHVAARAAADAGANLLANGSFEGTLAGWSGFRADLALVQNGVVGSISVRVALNTRDTSGGYSVFPSKPPVASTTAGTTYTAGGWAKGGRSGQTLCLKIRELSNGSETGSAQSCITSNGAWQAFPAVRYKAAASGRQLDAYVFAWYAKRGDSFYADGLSLTSDAPVTTTTSSTTTTTTTATTTTATTTTATTTTATTTTAATTTTGTTTTTPVPPPPPPPPPPAPLTATALDNAHVRLSWTIVPGAVSYAISRGGVALGTTAATTFTDTLLWPSTQYSYSLSALDGVGVTLSTQNASATTTALPASGFQRPFPATSVWNTPVGNAPVAANSAALVSYFLARDANPIITIHRWAVSVAEQHPSDRTYTVPCTKYTCTLSAFGAFGIPVTAKPDPAGDGHLAVYDPATLREWDMWQAVNSGSSWSSSSGAGVSMNGNGIAPINTAAGDAANFPLLAGIVRPEEILQGHIDHALVFMMPNVNDTGYVCPALHHDGDSSDPAAPMEGQRFQLDPSVNVDALAIPAWAKTIARALQVYGMYLRDDGGSFALVAENSASRGYDAWSNVGLGGVDYGYLSGIPWDKLRAITPPC
jgi:hypothetical protein